MQLPLLMAQSASSSSRSNSCRPVTHAPSATLSAGSSYLRPCLPRLPQVTAGQETRHTVSSKVVHPTPLQSRIKD
jgi:hypothetical protein